MERGIGPAVLTFRELVNTFRRLEIERSRPVLVHASLSAFGRVHGGAETVVGALLASFDTVLTPVFTYNTMVIPETGPPDNGLEYGSGRHTNRMAVIFRPDLPADRMMGAIPETLRRRPGASRSAHPILSFAGVNALPYLQAQTFAEPLGIIQALAAAGGYALLLGVNHTVNTSIHYAERLAGRKQFTRWALTNQGTLELPGFPGCSDGFQALAPHLEGITCRLQIGEAEIQALPLPEMVEIACSLVSSDPLALLCEREYCQRCSEVREEIEQ
jgi:aminoglycoside 3-N-acetyltransferase